MFQHAKIKNVESYFSIRLLFLALQGKSSTENMRCFSPGCGHDKVSDRKINIVMVEKSTSLDDTLENFLKSAFGMCFILI